MFLAELQNLTNSTPFAAHQGQLLTLGSSEFMAALITQPNTAFSFSTTIVIVTSRTLCEFSTATRALPNFVPTISAGTTTVRTFSHIKSSYAFKISPTCMASRFCPVFGMVSGSIASLRFATAILRNGNILKIHFA